MQIRMKIENPEDVDVTLILTMKTKEWDKIRNQLDERTSEGWSLSRAITDAFVQVRKIVYANQNEK